ncbi:MAG: glycosyltransferase family 39 protein [Deltaproteobacteria bacterium]|nr:glycosyltransferase family 39 protein [Deltaproteobacteria bacterium]
MNNSAPDRWLNGWTLCLACLAVYAPLFWQIPLSRSEGMYALIPMEMLASGSWLTPTLNGAPYLDKPPLLYWLNLIGYKIFGVSDWSARLPTLGLSVLEVWLTYLIGRRLLGVRAAWLGGVVLLSSVGFCALHLQLLTDHIITVSMAASLYFMMRWKDEPAFKWAVLFFLGLVAGFLSKSFIGAGFPVLICLLYALSLRQPRLLSLIFSPKGLALAILLIVPWFVGVEKAHPGFLKHQIINEQFLRFFGQRQPADIIPFSLWGFWVFLLIWLMPWTVLLPEALIKFWRQTRGDNQEARLLLIWAGVILGFFTLSASRIEYYSMPALPPLALVVGWRLERYLASSQDRRPYWALLAVAVVGMFVVVLLPHLEALCVGNRREFIGMAPMILPLAKPASFILPGLALGGVIFGRRRPWVVVTCFSALALVVAFFTFISLYILSPHLSDKAPAEYLRDNAGPQDVIVMERIEEFELGASLVFYSGRRLLMVQRDGLPQFPYPVAPQDNYLISPSRLKELWHSSARVFLLIDDAVPAEPYLEEAATVLRIPSKRLLVNRP